MAFLAIELLDEFVAGAVEAARPLIRTDLELSYLQIGVLPSAPAVFAYLIEPAIGILGGVWNRRRLILGGGVAFGAALVFVSTTPGFPFLPGSIHSATSGVRRLCEPVSGVVYGL